MNEWRTKNTTSTPLIWVISTRTWISTNKPS